MDAGTPLSEVLDRYMRERRIGLDRLAGVSGVHKQTLAHWRNGTVARPHLPDQLLRVATALDLNRVRASRLLRAAGHPPIDEAVAELPGYLRAELRDVAARWDRAAPNNLPSPPTSFVGRVEETLEVGELLCEREVRLVTLTGPGGSGKTRLALRVATLLLDSFPDGVWFVALAPLTDPDQVLPAIARTLGVREATSATPDARLATWLRERRLLLLLDNFEQLLDAGPRVVELLAAAPGLKVLATSRAPLHVSGEHERPVAPLPLPGGHEPFAALRENPAVQLFAARARAASPAFALTAEGASAVAELCARLDGLPLAIELAAARVRQFPPEELLARFPGRLDLSADGPRDAPARQRTLRATIGWSHDLLDAAERALFARLAVFAGGFTPEAAVAVCAATGEGAGAVARGLDALRELNLIAQVGELDGEPRYGMLETIREYALERLEASGEAEDVRRRHAAYFVELAERGRQDEPYLLGTQEAWLERLDRERDNLRAALAWARDRREDELLAGLAAATWAFWIDRGYFGEGVAWLETALARGAALLDALRAPLLTGAFILAFNAGDYARAASLGEQSLALWQALGDRRGQALVLKFQGWLHQNRGDAAGAVARHEQSLAHRRALGDDLGVAQALNDLALTLAIHGRFDEAEPYFAEALAVYERRPEPLGICRIWTDRGFAALMRGDLAGARQLLERALALARPLPFGAHLSWILCILGAAEYLDGALDPGQAHLIESLRLRHEAGDRQGIAYCLIGLAGVARGRGELRRAARLCGAAEALLAAIGAVVVPGIRPIYEGELRALRAALAPQDFAAAWAEGEAMPLERAIAKALGGDDEG